MGAETWCLGVAAGQTAVDPHPRNHWEGSVHHTRHGRCQEEPSEATFVYREQSLGAPLMGTHTPRHLGLSVTFRRGV